LKLRKKLPINNKGKKTSCSDGKDDVYDKAPDNQLDWLNIIQNAFAFRGRSFIC
jgi:hypothetical protein